MNQIVPFTQRVKTVQDLLVRGQKQIGMALPRHMTADRMIRIVLTEVQKTPELLDCDQRSLMGAVVQAAQLGLEPGLGGQAYLIPFKGRVQMIPGYRGLLALVYRSGQLESFESAVVRNDDLFEFERGLNPILRHKPAAYEKLDDSQITHAYAIARLKGGSFGFDVMSRAELDAIRRRSASANKGPWVTDFAEMCKKTVAKRAMKYLPTSIEMQKAIELDDLGERGISQGLESLVEIEGDGEVVSEHDPVTGEVKE